MDKDLKKPGEGDYGWKEILAEAFTSFFLSAPASAKELGRRIAVTIVLVMLSGGAYVVVREPEVISVLTGGAIEQQSMTQRMRHTRAVVEQSMEEWFYLNRPRGLMLVAWDDRTTLRSLWVKPETVLHDRIGIRQIAAEIKAWAGHFIFGECVVSEYDSMPNSRIAACPIYNDYDVWGYVAIVYNSSDITDKEARASLANLAHELIEELY
ncbi:MAG: hypothetical protein ACO3HF_04700 [Burkholderiaceae bacterium]